MANLRQICDQSYDNLRTNLKTFCKSVFRLLQCKQKPSKGQWKECKWWKYRKQRDLQNQGHE